MDAEGRRRNYMKILYLDCGMGAAGDMLTAALLELLPREERAGFIEKMNELGIPGVAVKAERVSKCGILGTHISVTVDGEEEESGDVHGHEHVHEHNGHEHSHSHHHHSGLHDIEHIVTGHLSLSEKVREDVLAVYRLIAEAESNAHGVPVSEIHFHEVGTMDAIADVTAVCLLMERLRPEKIVVSPIHVGSGQVRCAHGILPVPAPATAYILRDAPVYSGSIRGELCTPTGAALLKHFATGFGEMPLMKVSAVGYGMGKKDFEAANCVRAMLGEAVENTGGSAEGCGDTVTDLSCNVDDMTAEAIGFAMEQLFAGGALEVFTIPVNMKKCRPGTLIHVLCRNADKEKMISLLFRYTSTIGIRENLCARYTLSRRLETCDTPYGQVRRKLSSGYGVERVKYEYDDLSRIAREKGLGLDEVLRKIGG